jgi:hypothetical protein
MIFLSFEQRFELFQSPVAKKKMNAPCPEQHHSLSLAQYVYIAANQQPFKFPLIHLKNQDQITKRGIY